MQTGPDGIVVGAGAIGLACAWRLAQRGLRVTVIEAATPGSGASRAALGALVPGIATRHGALARLQRASLARFPAFAAELALQASLDPQRAARLYRLCGRVEVLGDPGRLRQAHAEASAASATFAELVRAQRTAETAGVDGPWADGGGADARATDARASDARGPGAREADPWRAEARGADRGGADARGAGVPEFDEFETVPEPAQEVLAPAEVARLEPALAPAAWGALWCRVSALTEPVVLIDALVDAARAAGVELIAQRCATHLVWSGTRVVGVRTSAGELHAGFVLVAAGHAQDALDPVLAQCTPVDRVAGQGLLLRVSGAPPSGRIVRAGGIYLLPRPPHHVVVGATTEHAPGPAPTPTDEGREALWVGACRLVPSLATARVEQHWAGLRPAPRARRPYLGPVPGTDGLFVAAGHYKTGLALAPITADSLAAQVLGDPPPVDLAPFAPLAAK